MALCLESKQLPSHSFIKYKVERRALPEDNSIHNFKVKFFCEFLAKEAIKYNI